MQCAARAVCLTWSLHLPKSDVSIYAGLGPTARNRVRRERAAALAASGGQPATVA